MTASTVLTALPRDASSALASAGGFDQEKVLVRFKAVGSAPQLKSEVRRISATQKFETVVTHLRKILSLSPTDGLFLYVNSAFAPALDEIVGNLHRVRSPSCDSWLLSLLHFSYTGKTTAAYVDQQCFKDSNNQLIVVYSIAPAFG